MLYNSNFDDATFKQSSRREYNRLIDDPCAIQQRNSDNQKKIKFVTTNHIDLLNGKADMNFFGMTMKDQLFVPSEKIDDYSKLLNGQNGGVLTNVNVKYGFGQLPIPTVPGQYQLAHGDVVIEDSIRNLRENNKNACNPRDTDFHDRYFYLFNDSIGIETPAAIKSVHTDELGPPGGISTRSKKNPRK